MAALLLVAVAGGAALVRSGAVVGDEPRKEVDPTALRQAEALSQAFHNAAEIAMPSVVTIRSKTKAHPVAKGRNTPRGDNPFKGSPLDDLFKGRNLDDLFSQQTPRREGMGSGVIIDASGIVLTNNHVVEGADEVIVRLADGREFKGEDIKTDDQTDMAVVRIKGAGTLPAAAMGDSDKLRVGDWVMAIGNPFEFEQTVSSGIISGMGRELGSVRRAKFLQTDAAINPGNSGGPLINLHGEVVGINTAIATNSGTFNGIGFAVPINLAKWVTGQLIQKGSVQRAYLGVGIGDMTVEVAQKLGAKRGDGVLVSQVMPGSPAAAAGFEPGDIVTHFAGHKVKNARELQELVERVPLDSKQEVTVLRDGKTHSLSVVTKALPKEDELGLNSGRRPERGHADDSFEADDLGIEVADLTADQAGELGLKPEAGGVLITKVDSDKPAAASNLRPGLVILKVGKKSVKNVDEFKTALKGESLKDGVLFYVHAREGNRFVVVKE